MEEDGPHVLWIHYKYLIITVTVSLPYCRCRRDSHCRGNSDDKEVFCEQTSELMASGIRQTRAKRTVDIKKRLIDIWADVIEKFGGT